MFEISDDVEEKLRTKHDVEFEEIKSEFLCNSALQRGFVNTYSAATG